MFERYTEEARRAIFFARAESLFRKAPAITVQDFLLGLTREKKSRANYICELESHDAGFRASFGVARSRSVSIPPSSVQDHNFPWTTMPRRRCGSPLRKRTSTRNFGLTPTISCEGC
jgi:hypothetical protein